MIVGTARLQTEVARLAAVVASLEADNAWLTAQVLHAAYDVLPSPPPSFAGSGGVRTHAPCGRPRCHDLFANVHRSHSIDTRAETRSRRRALPRASGCNWRRSQ